MKIFRINDDWSVVADTKKTRNGFKHTAVLMDKYSRVRDEVKINYLNRTWESYEYESVLNKLLESTPYLEAKDQLQFKKIIANRGEEAKEEAESMFKTTAMVAKMGEIFGKDQKEKNDWKARMLKAGLGSGFEMPEDWDTLSEEEKEKRLNKVIELASEKKAPLPLTQTKVQTLGSKGSGWHKEPVSHSYATKYGKAPKHVRGR
jgi:hypothetical protein